MSKASRPPLTEAHVSLINAGFRPRRHATLVQLSRRLLWQIIRPFHFYLLERLLVLEARQRHEAADTTVVQIEPGNTADLQSLIFSHAALRAEVVALTNRQVWAEQTLDAMAQHPAESARAFFVAPVNDGMFILRNDDPICQAASRDGAWGASVQQAAERAAAARPGTAVDIGAGVGLISVPLARRFEQVISFEANEINLPLLRANAALNGLQNIEIHDEAVESAASALDSLALTNLAFLTIGTPDRVADVLMGAMQTVTRCHPWVAFACNETQGAPHSPQFDAVCAQLTALGYDITPLARTDATRAEFLAVPSVR